MRADWGVSAGGGPGGGSVSGTLEESLSMAPGNIFLQILDSHTFSTPPWAPWVPHFRRSARNPAAIESAASSPAPLSRSLGDRMVH